MRRLGKALARAGHEAAIVTPLYRGVRKKFPGINRVDWKFDLPLGARQVTAGLWSLEIEKGPTVYFIDQPEFFERAEIYQENNVSYADNAERFIFFSKCVVHLARYLSWRPDLVHVHDWQAALVPALMLQQRRAEGWGNLPPTCLTIHNLAYQGNFPAAAFALTNLPGDFFTIEGAEFFGQLNCLKAGIAFADVITTVSPRYAREITTEEFGCGLDGFLRQRQVAAFWNSQRGGLRGMEHDAQPVSQASLFRGAPGGQTEEQDRIAERSLGCRRRLTRRCLAPSRGSPNKRVWTSNWARSRKC